MLTFQAAQHKQSLRAGIIARLKAAHGAIHASQFSEEARAELEPLAKMGLIMSLPGKLYTVIQPGKSRKPKNKKQRGNDERHNYRTAR